MLCALREEEQREQVVAERTQSLKLKVMKNALRRLVRKADHRAARRSLERWFEAVYVVQLADRFRIPAVDMTLRACQHVLYSQHQEKTVLRDRLNDMHASLEAHSSLSAEIFRAREERRKLEYLLALKTKQLHEVAADGESLVAGLRLLQAECKRLIEGGLDCFEPEVEGAGSYGSYRHDD